MMEINAVPAKGMEDRPVKVNLRKLTAGIGTMFAGVLEMLDALDATSASNLVGSICDGKNKNAIDAAGNAAVNAAGNAADNAVDNTVNNATDNAGGQTEIEKSSSEASPSNTEGTESSPASAAAEEKPAAEQAKSTLTQDDITRVIVRKIKQDRGNSEKIASILKTYGADRVSDLPTEKYEAFLTDISAI